jgi:hypothetical protein
MSPLAGVASGCNSNAGFDWYERPAAYMRCLAQPRSTPHLHARCCNRDCKTTTIEILSGDSKPNFCKGSVPHSIEKIATAISSCSCSCYGYHDAWSTSCLMSRSAAPCYAFAAVYELAMAAQARAHSLPALLLARTICSAIRQDCCLLAAVVLATRA